MAVKKYKKVLLKDVKIGTKQDGTPKREYKKGDSVRLTKEQIKTFKKNNLV